MVRAVLDTNVIVVVFIAKSNDSPNQEVIDRLKNAEFAVSSQPREWSDGGVGKLPGAGGCGWAMSPWHWPWRRRKSPIFLFFP